MDTTGSMLYEGKAKKIFAAARPDQVVHYFKDDATAFNAEKRGTIVDKGVVNNKVSERPLDWWLKATLSKFHCSSPHSNPGL